MFHYLVLVKNAGGRLLLNKTALFRIWTALFRMWTAFFRIWTGFFRNNSPVRFLKHPALVYSSASPRRCGISERLLAL